MKRSWGQVLSLGALCAETHAFLQGRPAPCHPFIPFRRFRPHFAVWAFQWPLALPPNWRSASPPFCYTRQYPASQFFTSTTTFCSRLKIVKMALLSPLHRRNLLVSLRHQKIAPIHTFVTSSDCVEPLFLRSGTAAGATISRQSHQWQVP
jgi:hypothetical protein